MQITNKQPFDFKLCIKINKRREKRKEKREKLIPNIQILQEKSTQAAKILNSIFI